MTRLFPLPWQIFALICGLFLIGSCTMKKTTTAPIAPVENQDRLTPPPNTPREQLSPLDRWDLQILFPTPEAWEGELKALQSALPQLGRYEGKLGQSPKKLGEGLRKIYGYRERLENVFWYSRMQHDADQEMPRFQAAQQKAQMLMVDFSKTIAFLEPEILAIPAATMKRFFKDPALAEYRFTIAKLLRQRQHVRSKEVEEVLAKGGHVLEAPTGIFDAAMVDIRFPKIKDEKGEGVALTLANFPFYRSSSKREVRREAVEQFFRTLMDNKNTLATALAAAVHSDLFTSQVHRYPTSLQAALYPDQIDLKVYDTLLSTLADNLPRTLHKYVALRKKIQQLDKLYYFDLYNPLLPEFDRRMTYAEGIREVEAAVAPLGKPYQALIAAAMRPGSGWIDIYPNQGKRSGAYSMGLYRIHPFILHNYMDDLDSAFTTAHEFGHALHSHASSAAQPYHYADYPIFLAEIASTLNEELLLRHFLAKAKNREEKLHLLNQRLEKIRTTIFRQAMFAEFEKVIHAQVEAGEPLTAESLNRTYAGLVKKYYGPQYTMLDGDAIEWAYIPHFYRGFYVFQYATGLTSSIALTEKILKEGAPAVAAYHGLLSAGASDYPLNTLKKAGVDLTTPAPFLAMLDLFEKTVDEFSTVYQEKR